MQNFALLDRDGKPVELSRYKGKPLLVNFVHGLLPGLPDHHAKPARRRLPRQSA